MRNLKHIKDLPRTFQPDIDLWKIRKVRGLARLDLCRERRSGIPEVILAEGKEPKDVAKIIINMAKEKGKTIATRVDRRCLDEIKKRIPQSYQTKYYEKARMVVLCKKGYKKNRKGGKVGIIAAGTSDISVSEEARVTCK